MTPKTEKTMHNEEKPAAAASGMLILLINCFLILSAGAAIVCGALWLAGGNLRLYFWTCFISILYLCLGMPLLFAGLKILQPNEAYVLTLFGQYYGTLRGPGFFFVNPFAHPTRVAHPTGTAYPAGASHSTAAGASENSTGSVYFARHRKKLSLKAMTLSNDRQKINDLLGNPIEIGIVVIWRVINTAQAVFNVDNYYEFLSIQCDSALRNIVRLYPYDISAAGDENSLRGSSQEVADKLKLAIQEKVELAGLEIVEARITHLAYAPEIAAAMLQRQQAAAIIDARAMIVQGAVDMVDMALTRLNDSQILHLDEERKAAMVSNLLVVLCGSKDAQPVINSGSIY